MFNLSSDLGIIEVSFPRLWDMARIAIALFVFQARRAIALSYFWLKGEISPVVKTNMGRVRLKIREIAEEKGWTLQDVADRSGVNYNTVKSYARRDDGMNMVDLSAVGKIARAFDVTIEELVEVLED
jgi:putative transcriptional regulator